MPHPSRSYSLSQDRDLEFQPHAGKMLRRIQSSPLCTTDTQTEGIGELPARSTFSGKEMSELSRVDLEVEGEALLQGNAGWDSWLRLTDREYELLTRMPNRRSPSQSVRRRASKLSTVRFQDVASGSSFQPRSSLSVPQHGFASLGPPFTQATLNPRLTPNPKSLEMVIPAQRESTTQVHRDRAKRFFLKAKSGVSGWSRALTGTKRD